MEEPSLEEPESALVGAAEPTAGFDDFLEHGLEACLPSDGAKDTADRALLLAEVLELTSDFRIGGDHLA